MQSVIKYCADALRTAIQVPGFQNAVSTAFLQSRPAPAMTSIVDCNSSFRPCLYLFLLTVLTCISLPLRADSLNIETRGYVYDPETRSHIYQNAVATWDNMTLESSEIRFFPEKNTAIAKGYVRFRRDKVLVVADRFELFLGSHAIFYNAILYDSQNRVYVTAVEIMWIGYREEGNYYVLKQCTFTTCNPKEPVWEISGSRIDYVEQNLGSSQHTLLRVQGVPVFYFPLLAWPTTTKRKTGFLSPGIELDLSNVSKFDLGYRIGIPFFWSFDPEHDLTLSYEWVEKRGNGLHGEYRYAFEEGMLGQLEYRRYFERNLRDPLQEAGSLAPESIPEHELRPPRFKFVYNHNQKLDQQSRLIVSSLNYSDGQFEREYERKRSPSLDSLKFSATVNRQFSNGSMSLYLQRHNKFLEDALLNRSTDSTTSVQKLPGIDYQFSEAFWKSGKHSLSGTIAGSLIRYFREQGWNGSGATATPRLSYLFPLTSFARGEFGIGRQFTRYRVWNNAELVSEDDYGFTINEAQAEISTTFARQFVRKSGIFARLKHSIIPKLQYDFIEDVLQISTSGVPFGGSIAPRRLATFRLENILHAKHRYFERPVTLSGRSLIRLRRSRFGQNLVRRLEPLKDRFYTSEKALLVAVEELLGRRLDSIDREDLLAFVEPGVMLPGSRVARRPSREGKAWSLASLDFIQHYDFLREDPDFQSLGPAPPGNETDPGQPLLPLRTELKINPGPNFSLAYFTRHDPRRSPEASPVESP